MLYNYFIFVLVLTYLVIKVYLDYNDLTTYHWLLNTVFSRLLKNAKNMRLNVPKRKLKIKV